MKPSRLVYILINSFGNRLSSSAAVFLKNARQIPRTWFKIYIPKISKISYCLTLPQVFVVHALFSSEKKTSNTESAIEESLITQADNLYSTENYEGLYNALIPHGNTENIEILWRLARAAFEKGKAASQNSDKIKCFEEGISYVNKGLKCNENHAILHKWFAILNDYKSRCEGRKARIENALINKEHMMRSVELSSSDPTVYHMLGYWCFAFASLTWYERNIASVIFATPPTSTFEEALDYFEKAEQMDPNFYSMNLLMLGKCHQKLGNKEKEIEYLTCAANYQGDTLDDKEAKLEAEILLKKLGR